MRTARRSPRVGRAAAVVIVAVALAMLLVAPAMAAPAATDWQVSPDSKTLTYGSGVILNGTLTSGSTALGGLWVDFAQATTSTGSYQVVYKVTTAESDYATGTYAVAVMPLQNMYYRFEWAGDASYAASISDVIPVSVKPSLGKPSCPSSVKKSKKFTVKGSVKPGSPTGPAVTVKTYRKVNGSWKVYKNYSTTISGTQYSVRIKITRTGTFKFKAVTKASASFVAGASSYSRVMTVKK